ncbi:hypothetical protein Dimus_017158 [Dionaea muscipula]
MGGDSCAVTCETLNAAARCVLQPQMALRFSCLHLRSGENPVAGVVPGCCIGLETEGQGRSLPCRWGHGGGFLWANAELLWRMEWLVMDDGGHLWLDFCCFASRLILCEGSLFGLPVRPPGIGDL